MLLSCVQSLESGAGVVVQVNPASTLQSCEQPSPSFWLPSSHSSPASTLPLPQLGVQACVLPDELRQIGSLVQVLEQPVPSPLKRPFGPVHPAGISLGSEPQSQASPVS